MFFKAVVCRWVNYVIKDYLRNEILNRKCAAYIVTFPSGITCIETVAK